MSLFGLTFLKEPTAGGWAHITAEKRYPSSGTYDVSEYRTLGGVIGLDPEGAQARGVVNFLWYDDPTAEAPYIGSQGVPLTSLIVSMDYLNLPNLGPYLAFTYKPLFGVSNFAARLFGKNVDRVLPGDTLMHEEDKQLGGTLNPAVPLSVTVYPCDYLAGQIAIYLKAVRADDGTPAAGVFASLQAPNLTDNFRVLRDITQGCCMWFAPLGTWCIVVYNPLPYTVTYTLTVTPLLT